MMLDDQQLTQLLRLKRFEQPPPGYFDQALDELHHRLRAGAVHRSRQFGWLQDLFAELNSFRVPKAAYAGAFGIFVVIATLMGTGVWSPRSTFDLYQAQAKAASDQNENAGIQDGRIRLTALKADQQNIFPTIEPSNTGTPRYIMGGQPVSYTNPSSF
jgi:hypothetical protein